MKIIDWRRNGNVVRLFLGRDNLDRWYGDDWNDRPYEHNAGSVYKEFVSGYFDLTFGFDEILVEPEHGHSNSPYCKDDFRTRAAPILVVLPKNEWTDDFEHALAHPKARRIYMGDKVPDGFAVVGED